MTVKKNIPKQHPNLAKTYLINYSNTTANGKSPAACYFYVNSFIYLNYNMQFV